MRQTLDPLAIKKLSNNIRLQIQRGKVSASKSTISRLQAKNQFAPNEDIISYVSSLSAANRYLDINRFYTWMERSPKKFNSKFFYRSTSDVSNERIMEAAMMAIEIAERNTRSYPIHTTTGHLFNSIRTFVNGPEALTPLTAIKNSEGSAVFEMANIAEYGSTAEARALYITKQGGLLFYAADRVQKKFPDLGIMFRYAKAEDFGLPHKYNVPVLTIGSTDDVSGPWVRPGNNHRRRQKEYNRKASAVGRIRKKFG